MGSLQQAEDTVVDVRISVIDGTHMRWANVEIHRELMDAYAQNAHDAECLNVYKASYIAQEAMPALVAMLEKLDSDKVSNDRQRVNTGVETGAARPVESVAQGNSNSSRQHQASEATR